MTAPTHHIVRGRLTSKGEYWRVFNCHPNGNETPCNCPVEIDGNQAGCGGVCEDTCACNCDHG